MDIRAICLHKLDLINKEKDIWYRLLKDKTEEQLRFQPNEKVWSPLHIVQHLIRTEATVLQYCSKKIQADELDTVNGFTSLKMWYMQFALFQRFIKYRAPKFVMPDTVSPDMTLDQAFDNWTEVRNQWKEFIITIPENKLDKEVYKQPFAGRLGWYGTLVFFEGHMARHMVQLKEVLSQMKVTAK